MYSRIEVAVKPEFIDAKALSILRRISVTDPALRKLIRWVRILDVYWMDVPFTREELIVTLTEVLLDPVQTWVISGNMMPAASGPKGTLEDLLETSPHRPGKFFAIEKRYRANVHDPRAKVLLDGLETVLNRKLKAATNDKLSPETEARINSGSILLIEGVDLKEEDLSRIAGFYFANPLFESWSLIAESELLHSERFFTERIKREMPSQIQRKSGVENRFHVFSNQLSAGGKLSETSPSSLEKSISEKPLTEKSHQEILLERIWKNHSQNSPLNLPIQYTESVTEAFNLAEPLPEMNSDRFKESILLETQTQSQKPWILQSGIETHDGTTRALIAIDAEEAVQVSQGMDLQVIQKDPVVACRNLCHRVIMNSVSGIAPSLPLMLSNAIYSKGLQFNPSVGEELEHPKRYLSGVRHGLSSTSSDFAVPMLNGYMYFDSKQNAKISNIPLLMVNSVSSFQSAILQPPTVGDRLILIGSPTSKVGLLGQQDLFIEDEIYEKRLIDFLVELQSSTWIKANYSLNGGGLIHALQQCSELVAGLHVDLAPLKTQSLRLMDLLMSLTAERFLCVVTEAELEAFMSFAKLRLLNPVEIGSVIEDEKILIHDAQELVFTLDKQASKDYLNAKMNPATEVLQASWKGGIYPRFKSVPSFIDQSVEILLRIISHPEVSSREWLIKHLDVETQGHSLIKPMHLHQGPNDAGVVRSSFNPSYALVLAQGAHPRWMSMDPYWAGIFAVDEAVRNALSSGADYGRDDLIMALYYSCALPQNYKDTALAARAIRALLGMKEAALQLGLPIMNGVENALLEKDAETRLNVHALARISKVNLAKTSDFKNPGDAIYLLGTAELGFLGSLWSELLGTPEEELEYLRPKANWDIARKIYAWMGAGIGKEQKKVRSFHDVSDGGILAAVTESIIARNYGAQLYLPPALSEHMSDLNLWKFWMGEGLHHFVMSASEADTPLIEAELEHFGIPYFKIGQVTGTGILHVTNDEMQSQTLLKIETKVLKQAWKKEGYWE